MTYQGSGEVVQKNTAEDPVKEHVVDVHIPGYALKKNAEQEKMNQDLADELDKSFLFGSRTSEDLTPEMHREILAVEINDLLAKFIARIDEAKRKIATGKDKERVDALVQKVKEEAKQVLTGKNDPEKVARMEDFANKLYEGVTRKLNARIFLENELPENFIGDLATLAQKKQKGVKKTWMETLPLQKDERLQAIKKRFVPGSEYIKYENGFPAGGFVIKDIVADDDDNDHVIIETVDGDKKISLQDLFLQYIDNGFIKDGSKKKKGVVMSDKDSASTEGLLRTISLHKDAIDAMFSEDAKQRYLNAFADISSEQRDKKEKFFDRTHQKVLKMVIDNVRAGTVIDDIGAFVIAELLGGNIYGKIRSIIGENNSNKKRSMAFDLEKNIRTDEQYGWSKEDKTEFDAEWKKIADKKYNKEKSDTALVDDPEAAALGGFDRNDDEIAVSQAFAQEKDGNVYGEQSSGEGSGDGSIIETNVKTGENWNHPNTEDLGSEFYERTRGEEPSGRKKNAENRDDVIEMERDVDGQWTMAEGRPKATNEQLKSAVENTRRHYVQLHYKNEGMINKIKAVFGHFSAEQDNDVTKAKDEYKMALINYREAMLSDIDDLTDEQKKKRMEEVHVFDVNEHITLYQERVAVKAEQYPAVGKITLKAIDAYRKIPTKYKIAFSAALLAGGAITSIGAAAGIFGAVAVGKRALGAGVAGVGVTGWMEARAQRKDSEQIQKVLNTFKEQSVEDQMVRLKTFDDASFQQLEKAFHGKIAGRSRRVMVGLAAAAGVMSVGSVAHAFTADENMAEQNVSAKDTVRTDAGINESRDVSEPTQRENAFSGRMERSHSSLERLRAKAALARGFAQRMNFDDLDNLKSKFLGGVPVEINGQPVPEHLYTDEQKKSIEAAKRLGAMMSGERVPHNAAEQIVAQPNARVIESGGLPDNINEIYGGSVPDASGSVETAKTGEGLQVERSGGTPQYTKEEILSAMEQSNNSADADNPASPLSQYSKEEISAAMEQSDASGHADNPFIQQLTGIEHGEGNVGELTIEKGSSVEKTLTQFLMQNNERLTAGKMGWDPERFNNVQEWAQKRAHVLAQEYARAHAGIDIDTVQPGTKIILDINDPADIKTDIEFAGNGPHIEATDAKVVMDTSVEPASPEGVAVGEGQSVENTDAAQYAKMSEAEIMQTLREQPQFDQTHFLRLVGTNIQKTLGTSSLENVRNIAGTKIALLRPMEGVTVTPGMRSMQQSLEGVISRAQEVFGKDIGAPRPNATVQSYFTRIIARSELTGKTSEIFPKDVFGV